MTSSQVTVAQPRLANQSESTPAKKIPLSSMGSTRWVCRPLPWARVWRLLHVLLHGTPLTTFIGYLVDQAALHGVLSRIQDMNLPLVSCPRSRRTRKMNRRPNLKEALMLIDLNLEWS